jgi:hypothetical protein
LLRCAALRADSPDAGPHGSVSRVKSCIAVKYWEIIADNLSKAGWSWGCVSAIDSRGRTIFVVDAHRGEISKRTRGGGNDTLVP